MTSFHSVRDAVQTAEGEIINSLTCCQCSARYGHGCNSAMNDMAVTNHFLDGFLFHGRKHLSGTLNIAKEPLG